MRINAAPTPAIVRTVVNRKVAAPARRIVIPAPRPEEFSFLRQKLLLAGNADLPLPDDASVLFHHHFSAPVADERVEGLCGLARLPGERPARALIGRKNHSIFRETNYSSKEEPIPRKDCRFRI